MRPHVRSSMLVRLRPSWSDTRGCLPVLTTKRSDGVYNSADSRGDHQIRVLYTFRDTKKVKNLKIKQNETFFGFIFDDFCKPNDEYVNAKRSIG